MNSTQFLKFLRFTFNATKQSFKNSFFNLRKLRFPLGNIPKLMGASIGAGSIVDITDDLMKNNNKPFSNNGQDKYSDFHSAITQNLTDLELKTLELINIFHGAITETSEKYRQCLEQQINIYEKGEMIDENNKYWDLLIENRGDATNLKQKLQNYSDMVQYVGKTVENVILLSTVMKKEMNDVLNYFDLKNLAEIESNENKVLEKKLLKATMKNIIQTKP